MKLARKKIVRNRDRLRSSNAYRGTTSAGAANRSTRHRTAGRFSYRRPSAPPWLSGKCLRASRACDSTGGSWTFCVSATSYNCRTSTPSGRISLLRPCAADRRLAAQLLDRLQELAVLPAARFDLQKPPVGRRSSSRLQNAAISRPSGSAPGRSILRRPATGARRGSG